MVLFVDSHCHIHFYDQDIQGGVVLDMRGNDIYKAINISTCQEDWPKCVDIALHNPGYIYSTIGVHPTHAHGVKDTERLKDDMISFYSQNQGIVGIGEIGIDTFHDSSTDVLEYQKRVLVAQIQVANYLKLPIVLHIRGANAATTCIDMCYRYFAANSFAIVHCHTTNEPADNFILKNDNVLAGIGGIITFKNCPKDAMDFIIEAGPHKLITETDAPYLAPMPFRGQQNRPHWVKFTTMKVAQTLSIDLGEFCNIVIKNLHRAFPQAL